MNKRIFIDIHAIQTVPPSCVNRDDTGSPKTAVYGGVERARVSSQAWKRAMRTYFTDVFAPEELGVRTKRVAGKIEAEILKLEPSCGEAEASKKALGALKLLGIKTDDKTGENSALFFISDAQAKAVAELIVAGEKDKAAYKQAMKDHHSFDIALFGRMVADDPDLNCDAAAQVAHAISTHGVHTEYDYFTAVDDMKGDDESGAGHLGTIEFNSSTLYRYATVNVAELAQSTGSDTAKVVHGFVDAFICSMPTGKQNTFANRTLPDMVYITIREDQPVNLSGAFESAVRSSGDGYSARSCQALLSYADRMYSTFADKPVRAFGCGAVAELADHCEVLPKKGMLDSIEAYIAGLCGKDEA